MQIPSAVYGTVDDASLAAAGKIGVAPGAR
jgi:hypothetical protein